MGKGKIDKTKLFQMLRAGKPQSEIAQVFGVSEGAISKMKKVLKVNITKNVVLESAGEVVAEHLDTIAQLRRINEDVNVILDGLMKEIKKGRAARESKKDLREVALKASQEIRGQLSLQLEIFKTLYDVSQIQEFQREVLGVIGQANISPCCQAEVVCEKCGQKIDLRAVIVNRLKQARALRSGVEFKP